MSSKVALITGAAKRIGAHVAKHLHQLNYRVIVHYQHSQSQAQSLVQALNIERENSACALRADLTEHQQVIELAQQSQQAFGRLDLLINNASAFYPTPVGSMQLNDWQALIGSNLQAPLFLSQALAPALHASKGNIINMLDIHAEKPLRQHTLYSIAKAGLVSMTLSLAQEMAPNVRVNGIAPGAILWPERPLSDSEKQQVLSDIPLKRLGNAQDIAEAVEYLVSANYVTGNIVKIDGGRSIANNTSA